MEAWDVIVLGDGPAALHAAAEAAKSGASTLMMSSTGLGNPGPGSLEGLSASLQESNISNDEYGPEACTFEYRRQLRL